MLPCGHKQLSDGCRVCWLAVNDNRYRQVFQALAPADPVLVPDCVHRGEATGELRRCGTCKEGTSLKLFSCAVHGDCTPTVRIAGHNCCVGCPERNMDFAGPSEIYPGVRDPLPTLPLRPPPPGWANRKAVVAQHQGAFRVMLEGRRPQPAGGGWGIVTIGGGKWWPMICVQIRMLRETGCNLPVQVWHRGRSEPVFPEDVRGLGAVLLIDSTAWAEQYPARILAGWPAKYYAVAHSGMERCLYLDADAYCVSDPTPLFALLDREDFVFWGDIPTMEPHTKWGSGGVVNDGTVPPIQGGHWLCHRQRWWNELMCQHWYNQHSEFWYSHSWSDQEGLRMILTARKRPGKNLGGVRNLGCAFSCDHEGKPYVVHRVQGKMWPPWEMKVGQKVNRNDALPGEKRAFELYEEYFREHKG